jgi:hypothetical protein
MEFSAERFKHNAKGRLSQAGLSKRIVQFLGDLAFMKRYWILKLSLTWVSEGPGQVNKDTIRSMLIFRSNSYRLVCDIHLKFTSCAKPKPFDGQKLRK